VDAYARQPDSAREVSIGVRTQPAGDRLAGAEDVVERDLRQDRDGTRRRRWRSRRRGRAVGAEGVERRHDEPEVGTGLGLLLVTSVLSSFPSQ
jgi:hypothetical protein